MRPGELYRNSPFWFSSLLVVALVGFYPSYFSRLRDASPAHHLHGVAATAWMVLLIVQSWLYRQRRFRAHRWLGRTSLALAPLFVASGAFVVHTMLASPNGLSRTFGSRLAFVDLTALVYFALAYALAIRFRRSIQLHARLMASTAILVLPPALSRALGNVVPAIDTFEAAFHWSFVVSELVVAALILHDHRAGKVHPPYPVLLGFLGLQQVGFLVLPGVSWWNELTAFFGRL